VDVEVAAREVATLKQELRNLAKAVASGGEHMPELLGEMKRRTERVKLLEADLAAARRTPKMIEELLSRVDASADRRLNELRHWRLAPARAGSPLFHRSCCRVSARHAGAPASIPKRRVVAA